MSMEKLSVTVERELLDEAREYAGPRGMSRFINEAMRFYLQSIRISAIEAELAAEYGPISEATKKRFAELEWIA